MLFSNKMQFSILLTTNIIVTAFMTGVIWLVQLVNYPLYPHIKPDNFTDFQTDHIKKITPLVAPVMITELFSSLALIVFTPNNFYKTQIPNLFLINFCIVVIIWLVTFYYSVPNHQKLKEGWDSKLHAHLVQSNWTRTIAWTLRSSILAYIVFVLINSANLLELK